MPSARSPGRQLAFRTIHRLLEHDGLRNSFFGYKAGDTNTTGHDNTFVGTCAGLNNTTGCCNSSSGYFVSDRGGGSQNWKAPVMGGKAVPITRDPGADLPHESPDGKFIFYSKGWPNPQSVWRVPVEGGAATKILDEVNPWALWTVGRDGIYFFTKPDKRGHSDRSIHEFATGKIRKILTMERPVMSFEVSADGRTVLYTQLDDAGSDLMLVENFR